MTSSFPSPTRPAGAASDPAPPVLRHTGPVAPASTGPRPEPSAAPFHRLARALPHRSWWWRPLVAAAVAAAVYAVMLLQLFGAGLVISVIVPGAEPSAELMDPHNPMDQLLMLGMLALMLPAVLIGTLAGYGRAGIAHSVHGRFRWGLAARASTVVVPLYLVVNIGANLLLGRDRIVVPELTAGVLLAWAIALLLVPLQSAGEEYLFRVLPMQALGTWMRTPLLGIALPIPLFVLGHGYAPLGQVDIALFALCMGLLAWKTGGIEIPVLLHVANNWTLFAIAPLVPGFLDQGEVTVGGFLLAVVPMLLCTAGVWWWVSRREGLRLLEPVRGTAGR